ncbi:MAG TPA: hypothetical protein ENJ42_04080 [Hellea balneolensis]|uniref:Uncharacterized protein n=1 Tax=Hellea balneolensis TaxID=287478 RepID=A0A7C5LZ45_9PROT|nr:hypothetical protein [Hellea balneolensis]
MRTIDELETFLDTPMDGVPVHEIATRYLRAGEEIMLNWLKAKNVAPTDQKKEGFSLLAWQRQGSKGDPSFNACRETCREIAWHYNLLTMDPKHEQTTQRILMMRMVTKHLVLFIGNKMQDEQVGEFCCSSRVNRLKKAEIESQAGENHG